MSSNTLELQLNGLRNEVFKLKQEFRALTKVVSLGTKPFETSKGWKIFDLGKHGDVGEPTLLIFDPSRELVTVSPITVTSTYYEGAIQEYFFANPAEKSWYTAPVGSVWVLSLANNEKKNAVVDMSDGGTRVFRVASWFRDSGTIETVSDLIKHAERIDA